MKYQMTPNFNDVRKALVNEVTSVTGKICILEEAQYQNAPRPDLPYFSMKMTTLADKNADDSYQWLDGTTWNVGGQRKMMIDFNAYANSQEEAYNLMCLWQIALEARPVQEDLRISGISVQLIGSVTDLSMLLNSGYEGRSHLDVQFGLAFNMTVDLGTIERTGISGTIDTDKELIPVNIEVPPT